MLRLLLYQKALIRRNELLRSGWRKPVGWLAGLALGAAFIYLVFTVSLLMFGWLLATQPELVPGLITGGFTLLATFALFWGIGSVLTDLYLASDLELLLAAPVASSAIFWLKLLGAMWQSVVPALIPIAMLLAFGIASGAVISYYLGIVLVLVLLLAILAAVDMALVMLLMRVMPARRAREIYSLVFVIFFAVTWLGWMTLSGNGNRAGRVLTQLGPQLAASGGRLALPPASWAGSMMLAWSQRDWTGVAVSGLLLAAAAFAVIGLSYWLFERSFHRDWATMHEVASRGRRPRSGMAQRPAIAPGEAFAGWLPWPARSLAAKDWVIMPRDLRQLSRMIMPMVVSLFYVYQFGVASPITRAVPGGSFWLMLAILPVVPLFFALAIGTPAIGKEAGNFELLRVAPVSPSALLWGKVWMAAVPTAVVALLVTLAVALLLHLALPQVLVLLALSIMFSAAMSTIAVAFGALTPNFHAVDYRRAVGPLAAYGTMFCGAAVWVVTLATVVTAAMRLPANHDLILGLPRRIGNNPLVSFALSSAWTLVAALLLDALVCAGLALLWTLATRRMAAWQPTE